jgi:hypothetical protein
MAGKKRPEALDRARKAADQLKPMAEQMKPLAKSAGQAANRRLYRTRAWAAPQVERTGKVLQDTVAPKVSAMLSTAAERIDPAKPQRGRWRRPVGIAAALAAAGSAAAAVFRQRLKTGATAQPSAGAASSAEDFDPTGSTGATPKSTDTGSDTVTRDHQAHTL